ncbi:MAG: metallophosphoesterase [Planctomycetota bacterium]|jgi:hypothetical protein|nr:MAG: metallophosphoesterase [Planctomycetota bacterium]
MKDDSADLAKTVKNGGVGREAAVPRRTWLKRTMGGLLAAGSGAGFYAWQIEPEWVEFVRRPLVIRGLPKLLAGCSLVQISDIHIGPDVADSYLIRSFKRIAAEQPDIVVFTGDFLTLQGDGRPPIDQMKVVLRHFPQGKLATIGILGNHDYGIRWKEDRVATTVVKLAEDAGLKMIRNQSCQVNGLQIVGFDDLLGPNFGGPQVLKNTDLHQPTLVLCHNPDALDFPIWNGYDGWILSGHTHGGQCKAPFLRPPIVPVHNKRYIAGEIPLADGRRVYVNRALGQSMRVRFNVRPEVTLFQLASDLAGTPTLSVAEASSKSIRIG